MEYADFQQEKAVAFTGHRFIPYKDKRRLQERLNEAIKFCLQSDIRHFFCGMAVGFDMLAAETVLEMKSLYPNLRITAVVPFRNQPDRFSTKDKERYQSIIDKADNVVMLGDKYFDGCYLRRNDYMLEHSCHIIAYFNGEPKGGTFYTCRRAERMGLKIDNLYQPNH